MKTQYAILAMAAIALPLCTSCGEDDAILSEQEPHVYLTPYGVTPQENALQQEFFNKNHIYVLFNDTLSKQQVSVHTDGTPFYDAQTVDMRYSMTSALQDNLYAFAYEYITDYADKQAAVQFVDQQILPALGPALRPFSFLLVNRIDYSYVQYSAWKTENPVVYAGWRCTALATSGMSAMTAEQKTAYRNQILKTIVSGKIATVDQALFDDFYAFCNDYYGTYKMREEAEPFLQQYPTPESFGLLPESVYRWSPEGSLIMYNIKAKNFDLEAFTNLVFDKSEAEIDQIYADSPVVIKKCDVLRGIIEQLGVIF